MATPFTSAQKAKFRFYLGWSARFHQFDSRLEQAMLAVDQEPDDATHDLLVAAIADCDSVVVKIKDAYSRLKARKVGSIDLPQGDEIGMLRQEGARYVGQIAATFGVARRHNVFSPTGPKDFAGFDGMSGFDNYFRHG